MEWSEKIIVEDQDGGYIVAILQKKKTQNADEQNIPLYKYKEYYHELETAIRDEF